jgi:serine/threonine protein kinase/Tol biopolymer transport system component
MKTPDEAAERIFGEALNLPREERSRFLDEACRGTPELRRAVEELLAENDRLSGFLSEAPYAALDPSKATLDRGAAAETKPGAPRPLGQGMRLGRYSIVEPLGSGGMGVVYRAHDEKLERTVAIKMLASGVLNGEEAKRHFRREALALAKLNHPRIAAVYDVGEQDGADFIVMELVAGQSLAAKLRAGALPVKEATAIALQVAEALEEAHEQGVIHRDLKPANIMITPKGNAKVLDFGLAKMLAVGGDATLSVAQTQGLMGTPLYMSPEQALGTSLDARTDLWSLGVVYYECLTRRTPFQANSNLAILNAITVAPYLPLREARADAPALAEQIVGRALEKDPELRYHHARDFATDLRRVLRDLDPRSAGAPGTVPAATLAGRPSSTRWRRAIAVMGIAAVIALLALAYIVRPSVPPPRLTGMRQLTHDETPKLFGSGASEPLAMFTDGTRVYFGETDGSRLDVMQVSTLGGESERVPAPFNFVGLTDLSVAQSKLLLQTPINPSVTLGVLWTMPLPAGQPQSNGNIAVSDAAWSPDAEWIYYTVGSDLWVARKDESQPRKILSENGLLGWIRFSHDGQRIRFSAFDNVHNTESLWEAHADGSNRKPVLAGWDACCGSWTPDGKYFVFASSRGGSWNLWAIREKREWWRRTDPEPVRLTVGQMHSISPVPSTDGKTIFFIGSTPRGELVRYDVQKRQFVPYLPGLSADGLAFSRDGSRVAWTTVPEGTLWQSKADGTDRHELTFAPMQSSHPHWSPDGMQIAFAAQEPGKPLKIYVVPAAGGVPEQVTTGESSDADPSWSPGGDALAFGVNIPNSGDTPQHPIQILNLKTGEVTSLPDSRNYFSPRWSPDGRWLLALDQDTFALELYSFTTHTWKELTGLAAAYPNWSADSQCVFFNVASGPSEPYYRICLSDRKPQPLVNLGDGGKLVSSTFNYWTGITPDGSILGIRDISIEEVYALDVQLP